MKVFLVAAGEYSDFRIIGAFSSRKKAEKIIDDYRKIEGHKDWGSRINSFIDEFEVDELNFDKGVKWSLEINLKNGKIIDCSISESIDDETIRENYQYQENLRIECFAKSKKQAIKIAKERRKNWIKREPKPKSEADNLYKTLKDDPEAVIKWAESEIAEYQKLIELIKNKT